MKYIRVCDEYENEYITTYQQHCEDVANMQDSGFDFEGCIIKQADTIEELIDGYVARRYVMDEPCHWFYSSKEQMKANISLRNKEYSIYGAIWVKGEHNEPILKPIAKMNDKGELELL